MFEWFERRVIRTEAAYREFPILKWRTVFFIFLVIFSFCIFQPLLMGLYKFNIMGMPVFQEFIQKNFDWMIWGQLLIPVIIAIWGWDDVSSLHDEKYLKRYGQLPKWAD